MFGSRSSVDGMIRHDSVSLNAWSYSLCPLHSSYFWNCVLPLSFTYNQLYKYGNITQLPEIIHSTQSCISDVKAWMTNNQLQLNNDKTEMILIATKTVFNSDSVPVHKSGGFWHQICQHSSQPRCLSWSYSLFPTANLLRLSYLLSWTSSD